MKFFRPIIDLILYGNFWIAACALAMTFQTQYLLRDKTEWTSYICFVGFSTLMLYALHRIVGLNKVKPFADKGRYLVIEKFKVHILVYSILGAIGALYCFFQLSWTMWLAMVIPAVLSIGYVLPILGDDKRLRDLDHIKIFLIALVWAWINVGLLAIDEDLWKGSEWNLLLMFFERVFFILAITIPFDIRDLKIDAHTKVTTLPSKFGIKVAKLMSFGLLFLVFCLALINWSLGFYSAETLSALTISSLSTCFFVQYSDKIEDDYFFTGLMDGVMILQFALIYGLGEWR